MFDDEYGCSWKEAVRELVKMSFRGWRFRFRPEEWLGLIALITDQREGALHLCYLFIIFLACPPRAWAMICINTLGKGGVLMIDISCYMYVFML